MNMKKIGIVYRYYPNWIGGTIYVYNLIRAIELIVPNDIEVILFIDSREKKFLNLDFKKLEYRLAFMNDSKVIRFFKKVLLRLFKLKSPRIYNEKLDAIFPLFNKWDFFSKTPIENQFFWIPDFQCYSLPHLFEKYDILKREKQYLRTFEIASNLVLSSQSVESHMKEIFPNQTFPRTHILRFATFNDEIEDVDLHSFQIDRPFIICPNQFWGHKNQILVLKAIENLNQAYLPFMVIFTGKEHDPRNEEHFQKNILSMLEQPNIKRNVKSLGFIDRKVQLGLIQKSIGLVQPSKFEGWSTVIEDGMFFNKPILASNLKVNIEQLDIRAKYFDVDDYKRLSDLLIELYEQRVEAIDFRYIEKQRQFGQDFIAIINS
jgi:glycosyltransferase involved in cell wall biosynthesis